jgi:hypothetical protein
VISTRFQKISRVAVKVRSNQAHKQNDSHFPKKPHGTMASTVASTMESRIEQCKLMVKDQSHPQFAKFLLEGNSREISLRDISARSTSICHAYDPENDNEKKRLRESYVCLACIGGTTNGASSSDPILLGKNTTANATNHLNNAHHIDSPKTL